ncbi:MAG: hypothetical protein PHY45_07650 [Rhodocyclaceae bacterium]|nr:hypothetical protein [Rhodocyclaceae bacterium]
MTAAVMVAPAATVVVAPPFNVTQLMVLLALAGPAKNETPTTKQAIAAPANRGRRGHARTNRAVLMQENKLFMASLRRTHRYANFAGPEALDILPLAAHDLRHRRNIELILGAMLDLLVKQRFE